MQVPLYGTEYLEVVGSLFDTMLRRRGKKKEEEKGGTLVLQIHP